MKKLVLCLAIIVFGVNLNAEDKELEKRQMKAIEQFVISGRKSDGNFTTISLKNWKSEIGIPMLSTEDMVRKVLYIFLDHYTNLEIKNFTLVYTNKTGPSGGVELDFILIHHETKPKKIYKFGTKEEL